MLQVPINVAACAYASACASACAPPHIIHVFDLPP